MGDLYGYRHGDQEPVKISSDVFMSYYESLVGTEYDYAATDLVMADRGKSVLFLIDPAAKDYITYGTLYLYHFGDESPRRILNNVREYGIRSNQKYLSSDNFFFTQYQPDNPDLINWFFYDGEKPALVAGNVG